MNVKFQVFFHCQKTLSLIICNLSVKALFELICIIPSPVLAADGFLFCTEHLSSPITCKEYYPRDRGLLLYNMSTSLH